jgi:hypothetical protein
MVGSRHRGILRAEGRKTTRAISMARGMAAVAIGTTEEDETSTASHYMRADCGRYEPGSHEWETTSSQSRRRLWINS